MEIKGFMISRETIENNQGLHVVLTIDLIKHSNEFRLQLHWGTVKNKIKMWALPYYDLL